MIKDTKKGSYKSIKKNCLWPNRSGPVPPFIHTTNQCKLNLIVCKFNHFSYGQKGIVDLKYGNTLRLSKNIKTFLKKSKTGMVLHVIVRHVRFDFFPPVQHLLILYTHTILMRAHT